MSAQPDHNIICSDDAADLYVLRQAKSEEKDATTVTLDELRRRIGLD